MLFRSACGPRHAGGDWPPFIICISRDNLKTCSCERLVPVHCCKNVYV